MVTAEAIRERIETVESFGGRGPAHVVKLAISGDTAVASVEKNGAVLTRRYPLKNLYFSRYLK